MTMQEPAGTVVLEPGIGSAYSNGWKMLWKNFGMLLLGGIVYLAISWGASFVISVPFSIGIIANARDIIYSANPLEIPGYAAMNIGLVVLTLLVDLFAMIHLMFGYMYMFLDAARCSTVELTDIFRGFRNYWNIVVVALLMIIVTVVMYLLVMVPFFFFEMYVYGAISLLAYVPLFIVYMYFTSRLIFVPFLLTDRKMGAMQSIRTSWNWTRGHVLQVLGLCLLSIPITIVGFLLLIIGVIPATMWIYTAFASMYHAVALEKEGPGANVAYPSPIIGNQ